MHALAEHQGGVRVAHLIHHHSLMLLHECSRAAFEVSVDAGQLIELERTRDFGIMPLVVIQGDVEHGRARAMVSTMLWSLGLEPRKYADMVELRRLVVEYLSAPSRLIARDAPRGNMPA